MYKHVHKGFYGEKNMYKYSIRELKDRPSTFPLQHISAISTKHRHER